MFEVQHVGIPTDDLSSTIGWYGDHGFFPVFQTVLEDNVEVAFIDVSGVLLECYTNATQKTNTPSIGSLSINSKTMAGRFQGPSGEVINFVDEGSDGLNLIELNSSSVEKTGRDLILHGFSEKGKLFTNGSVSFKINHIEDGDVSPGSINHIAFQEPLLKKRHEKIASTNIPIVEGVNYLPFFDKGVIYFVTENHDGLRLEYNQII